MWDIISALLVVTLLPGIWFIAVLVTRKLDGNWDFLLKDDQELTWKEPEPDPSEQQSAPGDDAHIFPTGPAGWTRFTPDGEWAYHPGPKTMYQRLTDGVWHIPREDLSVPRCIHCGAQEGLALLWVEDGESSARFRCSCGTTWVDPAWATTRVIHMIRDMDAVTYEQRGEEINEADPEIRRIFKAQLDENS